VKSYLIDVSIALILNMISTENLNQLKAVCKTRHVQKAILFGSHATNQESEKSDFDLVLI